MTKLLSLEVSLFQVSFITTVKAFKTDTLGDHFFLLLIFSCTCDMQCTVKSFRETASVCFTTHSLNDQDHLETERFSKSDDQDHLETERFSKSESHIM